MPDNQNFVEYIRDLVAKGKLKQALTELNAWVQVNADNDTHNDTTKLLSRYNKNESNNFSGTISNADYGVEQAKITTAVLSLTDDLRDTKNNSKAMLDTPKETGKLPETPSGFFAVLFNAIPKPFNIVVAVGLLGGSAFGAYKYFIPAEKPPVKKEEIVTATTKTFTIAGELIDKTSKKPLSNVFVGEVSNPFINEPIHDGGNYILPNVKISNTQIITLVVSYPDGTKENVQDIDLSVLSPDANGRYILPIKEVRDGQTPKTEHADTKKISLQKATSPNHYESKGNSKQVNLPNNNGTININQ